MQPQTSPTKTRLKPYTTPKLCKIGSVRAITLKVGSVTDSMVSRAM